LQCVSDRPEGFEWCVNVPAVDRKGVVHCQQRRRQAARNRQGPA
jgi:hypothetical protein